MTRRKTDAEFRAEVKALVGDEYIPVSTYKSNKAKIILLHKNCGELWQVRYDHFVKGQRCPVCKKQLATKAFETKVRKLSNGNYVPLQGYMGRNKKVLILHRNCGTKYYTTPHRFYRGDRCPVCQRKKANKTESISFSAMEKRISQITNFEYKILPQNYINTSHKAFFYHRNCRKIFSMLPSNFLGGQRCPFCKLSRGEKTIEKYLKDKNAEFEAQFKINTCRDKRPLPFDFAVFNHDHTLNCLIEYQGEQHFYDPFSYHDQWFSKESVLDIQKHDAMKLQYCKDHGIKLIRINHPQTSSKSNSIEFIERLVNRTLNKELKVS